jgi:hypothetical protein
MEEQTLQLEAKPEAAAPEVAGAQRVPDVAPGELARRRYIDVIGAQLDDALKNKTQESLANVMTFYLAWLVVEYGPGAAGHVLERLGSHIGHFTERNRAAREAEEAREAGRVAH